jgi:tetratricopeptide (TPR) repeat protein/predicted aspartyl protease
MRKIYLGLFAIALIASAPAYARCQVGKLLEFKVTMRGNKPLADVGINGRILPFVVDSGAFFNHISPGTAEELGLRLESTNIRIEGVGGDAGRASVTYVKNVDLAGYPLHDIPFLVVGSEVAAAGLIGQNVLGLGDVEYDLGHGGVRLMRSNGCSSEDDLAYWAGQAPVSVLTIDPRDERDPHTTATVLVNGVKMHALFDTGAARSSLSLQAAKRIGLTPSSPGVVRAGRSRGLGRSIVESWLAPVQSVKIGTEEVRNIKLLIGDIGDDDMLIGADFFLSHRIYVANGLHRIYVTYDGGPVFNMTPDRVVDEAGTPQIIAADSTPDPTDAAGFSRRGAAETSRRDYKAALADLDRAVAMEPGNGQYLLQRARVQILTGNPFAAITDLDQAVKVTPSDPQIRLAHADSLISRRRRDDAMKDLAALDATLPPEADERFAVAVAFDRLDQFDRAISDYDLWIKAHPDDSRQALALNSRCRSRALTGRDLPLALKDCDAALRRLKSGNLFDTRGLVELRMGQYDRAIADYDQALQLEPRNAWSLYGRGLARRHKKDPAAQDDLNAAVAINPKLPFRTQAFGIN